MRNTDLICALPEPTITETLPNLTKGSGLEVEALYIKHFPIYPANNNQQAQIELLVNRVMKAKSLDPKADTTALEQEIDQRVYQLYDLTPEEITLVEESTRK